MNIVELALGLVLLHGPSGSEIWVNPKTVTTMHTSRPGEANRHITQGARCLLNTTDGKFISVVETCDEVRLKFQERK